MTAVIDDPGIHLPHFPDGFVIAPPGIPEDEWHKLRELAVCGSEIATLLEENRFGGALQLFHEKRGEYTRPRNRRLETAARRGKRLESLVAEIFAEETGYPVLGTPGTLAHIDEPWMRVNLDNIVLDPDPAVLECKTRTWRSARSENWNGEDPPDGPTLQACWGMKITGWQRGYVAGLIDDEFKWFRIERDEEFLDHLAKIARRFYYNHLLPGIPPPVDGLESTAQMLGHLWDVKPGMVKIADPDEVNPLRAQRRIIKKRIKEEEEELRKVEGRMKVIAGDAETIQAPDGTELFRWPSDGNFSEARFATELPETAREYTKQVDAIDLKAIKTKEPALYAKYRGRVLRDGSTS